MDYSADLPINSMGRRVRSRLYFTSESHLHSLLNVLRFPSIVPSPLSLKGQKILANANEICYLTQVVIRLFEDIQKPAEDPRRFRVEILFSPGATATPLHMAELYREKDETRFDTEELQQISIDSLTCAQVEEYLTEAIKEGKPNDVDDVEVEKKAHAGKKEKKDKSKKDAVPIDESTINGEGKKASEVDVGNGSDENVSGKESLSNNADDKEEACDDDSTVHSDSEVMCANHFWQSAAVVGVMLGAMCLFMMTKATKVWKR